MPKRILLADPRHFQIFFLSVFLCYGMIFLGWGAGWLHDCICIAGCLVFHYAAESIRQRKFISIRKPGWALSILISALSLCLLLKTNHWYTSLLAALLTVASKYIFRFRRKHIFNPSAFGIVATILISSDAWLSPGQWGNNAVLFFLIIILGTIVVTKVQKLDLSLGFLFTFAGLLYWRQVIVLGWPLDYFLHSINTGSLLLFSFFMISDPKTSPDHVLARLIWSFIIGATAFYLAVFKWMYSTPVWVLVAAAPLVPLLNSIFKAGSFEWNSSNPDIISSLKKILMRPIIKKLSALLILVAMISHEAMAFCGFYVSKADGTLKNKTSQVILVHDGERNVITMYNDFKGDFKDFAMVVPVPVVLKKSDIKVVDEKIFKTISVPLN